jgi:RNA polymerase sigma factor (sigma-70 family)
MDAVPDRENIFTKYAEQVVRFKARQLSRRKEFCPAEEEDLRQELYLHLHQQAEQFDPSRGSLSTFIDRLVQSAVKVLLRNRRCRCRAVSAISLDSVFVECDGESRALGQTVSGEDLHRRTGYVPQAPQEDRESREFLDAVLPQLSPAEQKICRRLTTASISTISRERKITRRSIRMMLRNIRQRLKDAGFENS